ncbi:MAG: TetR/AcrR family transcriptional regulator [Proteobacteria bacterium]|nr:TetR/AcrR family transcriptional regulator [Pseudomonadota bacterium]
MSLREQKKVRARSDILAATRTLIGRKGYESTTMRDIAEAAKLSYQTLYNYFPSKAQIVQAMLSADVARIDARFTAIVGGSGDLTGKLHQLIKQSFDLIAHRERALWREIVLDVLKQSSEFMALMALIDSRGHQALQLLLRNAQRDGELDPYVDADLVAHTLYSITDFAFLRFVLEPNLSKVVVLKTLRNQVELLVQPYLRTT